MSSYSNFLNDWTETYLAPENRRGFGKKPLRRVSVQRQHAVIKGTIKIGRLITRGIQLSDNTHGIAEQVSRRGFVSNLKASVSAVRAALLPHGIWNGGRTRG